jgi:hypothetical protein
MLRSRRARRSSTGSTGSAPLTAGIAHHRQATRLKRDGPDVLVPQACQPHPLAGRALVLPEGPAVHIASDDVPRGHGWGVEFAAAGAAHGDGAIRSHAGADVFSFVPGAQPVAADEGDVRRQHRVIIHSHLSFPARWRIMWTS